VLETARALREDLIDLDNLQAHAQNSIIKLPVVGDKRKVEAWHAPSIVSFEAPRHQEGSPTRVIFSHMAATFDSVLRQPEPTPGAA
jgi:hypothetical protein